MTGPHGGAANAAEALQRALALIHAGQLSQAEALCRGVLAREPRNFNALQLLGHIALQSRDPVAAATWLMAARQANAANPAVHSNLAVALLALGRPLDALASCDAALRLKPAFPEASCNRGHALRALGRHAEALESYGAALAIAPAFADAELGRAEAWAGLHHYEQALTSTARVLQLDPGSVAAWGARGRVLMRLKRPAEALAAFDRALSPAPDSAEMHNNRGTALRDLRRREEALGAFARALELRPRFAEAYCNVANVGLDAGRADEALAYCDRALAIRPRFLEALTIKSTALRLLKRYAEAAATDEQIVAIDPDYGHALSHLLIARAHLCDWTDRARHAVRVVERINAGESASSPHTFLWLDGSAAAQLKCARLYCEAEFPAAVPLYRGTRYAHDRLRVAYLSADFGDHPVAHLLAGVLELHDRDRFEVHGVSLAREPGGSAMGDRIRQAFEHFDEADACSDREVAQRLCAAEIDIAVDLTGHTSGGRLGIFALRAAPVQISYLGFTGTSGASFMDYLIADAVTVPAGAEALFSERVIRLPHCFLPNDDTQSIAAPTPERGALGLPDAAFVFCAFNNPYKLNPLVFEIWMRLLQRTPHGVLWLRGGEAVASNLRRAAESHGVAPERLVFAPRLEVMDDHLARYRQADLFLDTLPYGAHATARDALWAGLPVLTCTGEAFATRVAASLLTSLMLPSLVTQSLDEYERRALELTRSSELGQLRAALDQRRGGPTFDTDQYRRHLEAAFLAVHDRHRRGEPARSIDIPFDTRPSR